MKGRGRKPSRRGHEGRPETLASAMSSFLERSGLEERIEAAAAVPEWPERVGDAIAAVTRPIRVTEDGTLLVAVRTSAWLMELRMMEREIVRRLNADKRRGRVQSIRFLIDGGEDAPEGDRPRRRG